MFWLRNRDLYILFVIGLFLFIVICGFLVFARYLIIGLYFLLFLIDLLIVFMSNNFIFIFVWLLIFSVKQLSNFIRDFSSY